MEIPFSLLHLIKKYDFLTFQFTIALCIWDIEYLQSPGRPFDVFTLMGKLLKWYNKNTSETWKFLIIEKSVLPYFGTECYISCHACTCTSCTR